MSAPFPLGQTDLTAQHLERQQQLDRAARLERARARLGPAPTTPAQPGQPAPPAAAPATPAAPSEPSGLPTQADENLAGQRAGAVAADVGRGLFEGLPQAGMGALESIKQSAAAVKDIADLLPELPGVIYEPGKGVAGLRFASGKEIKEAPGALETVVGGPIDAVQGAFGEPQSVTGAAIRGTAQFLAPFLATGSISALQRLSQMGTAGAIAAPLARGAIADFAAFDPAQKRLSDLVQQVPALQNPVTEYLKSDPTDSAAEGRFKQALEGAGLGVITEGLTRGLSALRGVMVAKQAAGVSDEAAMSAFTQAKTEQSVLIEKIGDPAKPALTIVPPAETALAAGGDVPGQVFVNFSRINSHDDVKTMIQELADARGGNIDTARRGVRSWEATKLDAATKDAWGVLAARKVGQPLNAEETFAVRELWVRSGSKVRELAQAVAANGGDLDQIAFRKQLLVHNAIQEQVIAARTETARALGAWAIPAGDTPAFAGQLDQLRALAQGNAASQQNLQEIAQKIVSGTDAGLHREVDAFIEASAGAKTAAAVRQAWYGALLSNPATHIRNITGNTAQMLLQVPETRLASAIGKLRGQQNVPDGEAMERLFGLIQGYQDAWSISKKSAEVFESALDQHVAGNPEAARELFAEEADQFFKSGAAEARGGVRGFDAPVSGAFEELMGPAFKLLDTATTAPSRALQATDEIFKGMNFNAELRSLAYRQAQEELAGGQLAKEAFDGRLAEILASPSDSMRLAARSSAERQTFTNAPLDTKMWQFVRAWHRVPVFGDITMPFARTPYNIATQTMQRTPLAPFMKSWQADIKAGGARADLAWSRFVLGNSVLLTTANLAVNGRLTGEGPSDPDERATLKRQGWSPWSVKVGDRFFDYRSLGTVGPAIGLAANTAEILAGQDWDDAESRGRTEQLVIATSMAIAAQVTNQSFMTGASSFFDAMSDPQRYGEKWWQQLATSALIPRGVAAIERTTDPNQRLAWDIGSAIRSQTPGLSKDLPPARDLWGRAIKSGSGFGPFYDLLSPFSSSKLDPQPIDAELQRIEKWIGTPGRRFSIDGANVDLTKNPKAYSRYVELAGNEWAPEGEAGLMDTLNAIVTGQHDLSDVYQELSDGADGSKAEMLEDIVNSYRDGAKQKLLEEFPELRSEVERKQSEKMLRLSPQ